MQLPQIPPENQFFFAQFPVKVKHFSFPQKYLLENVPRDTWKHFWQSCRKFVEKVWIFFAQKPKVRFWNCYQKFTGISTRLSEQVDCAYCKPAKVFPIENQFCRICVNRQDGGVWRGWILCVLWKAVASRELRTVINLNPRLWLADEI